MVTLNDCRQGNTHEYMGQSTDEKPTEGVGVNSLFLELDTLDIYYFNGEEWAKCGEGGGGNNVYLLHETEVLGIRNEASGGAYIYIFPQIGNSFDADAKTALETLTGDGIYPTLTITCPELNIDGVTLEWSTDNEDWEADGSMLTEDHSYTLGIIAADAGDTVNATITLSFPEPEA